MTKVVEDLNENDMDEIETKVINRLKKTVIIKRELSDSQKDHLSKLAVNRKGKKYSVIKEEPEPEILKVKRKKVVEQIVEETETESESESEEPIVKTKKKAVEKVKPVVKVKQVVKVKPVAVKKVVKKKVIKKTVKEEEPFLPVQQSKFKNSIF